jgi:dihydrofolate reductase
MSKGATPPIYIIVAMTKDRVIGNNNSIPWHIPEDLKTFKRITSGGVVIMGRRTFESIGRPLPNRHNLVISTSMNSIDGAEVVSSIEEAIERAAQYNKKIFFIGGGEIYKTALNIAKFMYISWIPEAVKGDTKFPVFNEKEWDPVKEECFEEFDLVLYQRK